LHDRIRHLERARRLDGEADSSSCSEFQSQSQNQQPLPSADGGLPRQLNISGSQENQQDAAQIAAIHGVQSLTPQQNTAMDQESPHRQLSPSREAYLHSDRAYLDGPSGQVQNHTQRASNAAGSTYFSSHRPSAEDGSIPIVHAQQMESPSVSIGSQTGNLRQESTERDSPVNAMGTVSAITEPGLDSSDHFYGTSSIVSFSQQIYQTQQRLSGRADCIPGQTSASAALPAQGMLSELLSSIPTSKPDDYFLPPRVLADHLLSCYWNRVHCLYPFVHQQSFISAYNLLWGSDTQEVLQDSIARVGLGSPGCSASVFYCALNAIFALGCQFSDLRLAERENLSETFFRRSKQLLRIDILDEGSLALIQTLLIVAQFLQSTQFPNRCWNVVGLACRIAQGLGLHLDSGNDNKPFVEVEMRRRTWYGCVTLDL
jgi:hypothetical protein